MKHSQMNDRPYDMTLLFLWTFVLFTFGWQLFFYFPLFFVIMPFLVMPLMGRWHEPEPYDPWYEDGAWRDEWYGTEKRKRKRKPKNDDYIVEDQGSYT